MLDNPVLQVNGIAVAYRPRATLTPHASNPNSHSPKQVERIARSIRDFGWTNPIIFDECGGVGAMESLDCACGLKRH